jgi:hypothetical protein
VQRNFEALDKYSGVYAPAAHSDGGYSTERKKPFGRNSFRMAFLRGKLQCLKLYRKLRHSLEAEKNFFQPVVYLLP